MSIEGSQEEGLGYEGLTVKTRHWACVVRGVKQPEVLNLKRLQLRARAPGVGVGQGSSSLLDLLQERVIAHSGG